MSNNIEISSSTSSVKKHHSRLSMTRVAFSLGTLFSSAMLVLLLFTYSFWPTPTVGSKIQDWRNYIESSNPSLFFLGNSILGSGIDEKLLEQLLDIPVGKAAVPGSESAWWFAFIKNVLSQSDRRPKTLALVFRDNELTVPTLRVEGRYRKQLDTILTPQEMLIEQRALLPSLRQEHHILRRYVPAYRSRTEFRHAFEGGLKRSITSLLRYDPDTVDRAFSQTFAPERYNPQLRGMLEQQAEETKKTHPYDFQKNVKDSFIPDIISLARSSGMKLIFIRSKKVAVAIRGADLPRIQSYVAELESYLSSNNVSFIDLTSVPEITADLYNNGDHFNLEGKQQVTHIVANIFKANRKYLN